MSNEEMNGEDAAYANGYQAGRDSRQFEIDMFRSDGMMLEAAYDAALKQRDTLAAEVERLRKELEGKWLT